MREFWSRLSESLMFYLWLILFGCLCFLLWTIHPVLGMFSPWIVYVLFVVVGSIIQPFIPEKPKRQSCLVCGEFEVYVLDSGLWHGEHGGGSYELVQCRKCEACFRIDNCREWRQVDCGAWDEAEAE